MAYKALYREFRPRRFADLKGQDVISAVLKNQIKNESPAHAYLFSGPRGTGKTSTAKILASALNCLNPQEGEPCLACDNCVAALNDAMLDIVEMDAASNNGVDAARDIRDKAGLLPTKGKYKVYIIDEVHMLTGAAFNALLKTLEEPPSHVVFILATTEIDALPKTVLSRCQRFDFKLIDETNIIARMNEVLKGVGATADEDALETIAQSADGALRDALTILEKCVSYTTHITSEVVASVLGHASKAHIARLISALATYNSREALSTLLEIVDSGVECGTLTGQILQSYEQMLLANVMDAAEDEWIKQAATELTTKGILRGIDIFSKVASQMRYAPKQRILLESAVMQALLPEEETGESALEERIRKLERQMQQGVVPLAVTQNEKPAPQQTVSYKKPEEMQQEPQKEQEPEQQPTEEVQGVNQAQPSQESGEGKWAWVLESYKSEPSAKPVLAGLVLEAEQDSLIILQAENPMARLLFESSSLQKEIEEKLAAQYGKKVRIQVNEQVPVSKNTGGLNGLSGIDILD